MPKQFLSIIACVFTLNSPLYVAMTITNDHFKVNLDDSTFSNVSEVSEIITDVINYWSSIIDYAPTNNKVNLSISFSSELSDRTIGSTSMSLYGLQPSQTLDNNKQYNVVTGAEARLKLGISSTDSTDFSITFSSNYNFSYSDTVSSSQVDFYSVLLHEITHGMGFVSKSTATGWQDHKTAWDALMNIDYETYKPGDTISIGDPNLGLYVYNPETWRDGSSMSHITQESDPDAVMNYSIGNGVTKRTLSTGELALLQEMGWKLNTIPEPSTTILSLLAFTAMMLRRKRTV